MAVVLHAGGGSQAQVQPSGVEPTESQSPPQTPSTIAPSIDLGTDSDFDFKAGDLWALEVMGYDEEALAEGISPWIAEGFQPVGMQTDGSSSVLVLFARIPLEERSWYFEAISPLSQVNQALSASMQDAWMPVDFSLGANDMHVLYVRTFTEFKSWRILSLPIETDRQLLAEKVAEQTGLQLAEGRYLFGLALSNDQLHLMFVESTIAPTARSLSFRIYPNDGFSAFKGIDDEIAAGAVPAAFAFDKEYVYVPFYY